MLTKLKVKRVRILCGRLLSRPGVTVPEGCFGLTNSVLISVGVNAASLLSEQLAKPGWDECLTTVQKVYPWESHQEAPS